MNVAIPSGKLWTAIASAVHYPHASQPMGMFRIRDSPNLLDAVQLVRILGIRDELVDKPGDEDTSEKSEGGYQTAPCRTFRDDFELLTRTEKQLHERYVYHHSGGKPREKERNFALVFLAKKAIALPIPVAQLPSG